MKEYVFIITPESGKPRRVIIEAETMAEAMDELQAPKGADIDVDSVRKVDGDGGGSGSDKSDSSKGDTSGDSDEASGGDSGDESDDDSGEQSEDESESNDDSEHVEPEDGSKDDEPERGHWWDGDWDRRKKRRKGGD